MINESDGFMMAQRILNPGYFVLILCMTVTLNFYPSAADFSHEWAVEIDGGDHIAHSVANQNNFDVVDKVFGNVYVFKHRRLSKRSARPSVHHHHSLRKHPQVNWAKQQEVKIRRKRDYQTYSHMDYLHDATPTAVLNDPKWPQMWYLNRGYGLDMRVQEAWALGVTGKGVVATILDDGLEKGHPDIVKNYDPGASYDVNNRDEDPMPRYDLVNTNRHGTRCAGEVAADANNSICAVGVAFEASIGGVRMLDGDVTDAVEARSLSLNPQHIDIYSASWGPDDDGKTVDGPGELATRAFIEGINNGRGGRGSIFIWASGNGGKVSDNCNCDGYTNAIWTLSISSATEMGNVPWYSEACSSTLATTYSSGSSGERKIITTDLHHECTTQHTGTSASAPLAAGIVALALEVNRNLTWRDMQHIVVRTARPDNLISNDWQTNGVGRNVSHRFGYGLMDATAMVKLAKNWVNVAPQRSCEVQAPHDDKIIPQKSYVTLKLIVSECPGVNHLEHVQAMVTLSADRRGDIDIFLISPSGTRSTLLTQRPHDNSKAGFHSWPFMSVHMWGEQPLGEWKLEVHNNGHFYSKGITNLHQWYIKLNGSPIDPAYLQQQRSSGPYKHQYPHLQTSFQNHYFATLFNHHNYWRHTETHSVDTTNLSTKGKPDGKTVMSDFKLVLHGTSVEPGTPSPSAPSHYDPPDAPPLHQNALDITHQDLVHKDSNTQRHNTEDYMHPGEMTHSGASTLSPSVQKKSGVEKHLPHPVKMSIPPPGSIKLPEFCSTIDPNTQACLECVAIKRLYRGTCVNSCPEGHFEVSVAEGATSGPTLSYGRKRALGTGVKCEACHFTCKKCIGKDVGDCTACWEDGVLDATSGSGHCISIHVLVSPVAKTTYKPLGITMIVISVLLALTLLSLLVIRSRSGSTTEYHPVDNGSSTLINEGVKKLMDLKAPNGNKNSNNTLAAYRKLSEDTEHLVTSAVPFYDLSSSDEEMEILS